MLLPRNTNVGKLVTVVICVQIVQSIAFIMIDQMPIAEVSLFLNIGPILAVFVSGYFLPGEQGHCIDFIKVIFSFIGVTLIVFGKR